MDTACHSSIGDAFGRGKAGSRWFVGEQSLIRLAGVVIAAGLMVPLLFSSVPPFCDLYFHIARMVVLENPDGAYVRDWYAPDWHLIPNLAMDVIVPGLGKFMPLLTAARVFVALTLLLIFSGTVALHHALYRRLSWLPLLAALFVYNQIVFFGYFNYLFGVGAALWASATWFYLQERPTSIRIAVASLCAIVLYACHFFAVGLFGLVIASSEIHRSVRDQSLGKHALLMSAPFLLPVILLLTSRTVEASDRTVEYLGIAKLLAIFTIFNTTNPPIDLYLVIAAAIFVGSLLFFRRAIQVSEQMRLAVILLPILVLIMPTGIFGTFYADLRLPVAAIFFVIAASRLREHMLLQVCAATIAMALLILRLTALSIDFRVAGAEADEIRTQFHALTPGSVVFTANLEHKPFLLHALVTPSQWNGLADRVDTLPLDHFTTIALLDQAVFVPQTLMIDGQQPARMKTPFDGLKALQADALGTWSSFHEEHVLQGNGDLAKWVERIKAVVSQPPYKFAAIYVALVDPEGIGEIPGAKQIYAGHGYRLWDVSTELSAGG